MSIKEELRTDIESCRALISHDWDGEGASAIPPTAVDEALRILDIIDQDGNIALDRVDSNPGVHGCVEITIDTSAITLAALGDGRVIVSGEGIFAIEDHNWLRITKELLEVEL